VPPRPNWFVAIAVPAEDWWSLVPEPPPGVRGFDPADLHITVAFLGPTDRQRAERAFALAVDFPRGPIDIRFGDVEAMGDARRPAAYALAIERGFETLVAGMNAVREPMWREAGARGDARPPKPHVTIGRPRRKALPEERAAARAWARSVDVRGRAVRLHEIVLYTWSEDRSIRQFREHLVRDL
jgi:2'-5' RNA ligase